MEDEDSIEDSIDEETLSCLTASGLLPGTELEPSQARGETPGKKANAERDFSGAHQRLVND